MRLALSMPKMGYYQTCHIFGSKGDFVTSPEISQLFGEILAVKIRLWLESVQLKSTAHIVDLGPGNGTLLYDILKSLKQFSGRQSVKNCTLLEFSDKLIRKQQEKLGEISDVEFRWVKTVEEIPSFPDQNTIFVAHEFFDALPVRAFRRNEAGGFLELYVALDYNNDLCLLWKMTRGLDSYLTSVMPQNYSVFEISFDAISVAQAIKSKMETSKNSLFLAIDYGRMQTAGLTIRVFIICLATFLFFQAIRDHQILDSFLKDAGLCDISADVNFDALANIFEPELNVTIQPQGDFLQSLGLRERAIQLAKLNRHNTSFVKMVEDAFNRLVSPKAMGNIYKVMSVQK